MDDEQVLAILETADEAPVLPRLGGMARPHGVLIGSETSWAFATTTGTVTEGAASRILPGVSRVPILRGLVRLASALAPMLVGRQIGAKRERPVFLAALALPLAFAFLPSLQATALGFLTSLVFVFWLFRGRTLYLHGRSEEHTS